MVERRKRALATKTAAERRREERRDSPRVPFVFLLREEGTSAYRERYGELALGGISWRGPYPNEGMMVDVRFRLDGSPRSS